MKISLLYHIVLEVIKYNNMMFMTLIIFIVIIGSLLFFLIDSQDVILRIQYKNVKFRVVEIKGKDTLLLLQVKKWWMLTYHDCYWKNGDTDNKMYHPVMFNSITGLNRRGIPNNIGDCMRNMICFIFFHTIPIELKNEKQYNK